MSNRREIIPAGGTLLALSAIGAANAQAPVETVEVDLHGDIGKLDHIWSRCVGSDRAEITMRESWRQDARRGRQELGIERVRFHGIFDDELGVGPKRSFGPASAGFNFQNRDAFYDGLQDLALKPFVEMSFMPGKLASGTRVFPGSYKANVTPPASLSDWQDFVRQLTRNLFDR